MDSVVDVASKWIAKTKQVSPSTKVAKPAQERVFGPGSQFRGIGVGVKGDPRK